MAYYTDEQLKFLGFRSLGKSVRISDKALIYNADQIDVGDYSRIDDLCVISGRVVIGRYCHITPMCIVAGGVPGVYLSDFVTLAYGVKVFSQSDDYSGMTMTNSLVAKKFKQEIYKSVHLERQCIVGAGSAILPGVTLAEGCSVGAMSLVLKSTEQWGIYTGVPVRRIKDRKKDLLELEVQFLKEQNSDSV
jgi:acetyltransferase-like isoleucine patch superfamily enzyme